MLLGAIFVWPIIELAGPMNRDSDWLTAILFTVVYVSLCMLAGYAIERAVR